eukprot:gnl/TRDRNA2_/TRDRNA2_153092_c0_seq1.p1 gnl/TRDRNA2_/TRDRNA2_153092_c0~~gnl/TRDRNA2_/TRDRNA2_153092_c0_seq1.p1  ORF type:complete len:168 (+),score=23.52 gnl/TRDRNA2_/TRDRNA2_153092_c0_seq1:127-630(+)
MGNSPCCLTAKTAPIYQDIVSSPNSYEESPCSFRAAVSLRGHRFPQFPQLNHSRPIASKDQQSVTFEEKVEEFETFAPGKGNGELRRRERRDQTGAPPRLEAPGVTFEEAVFVDDAGGDVIDSQEMPEWKRSDGRKGTGYVLREQPLLDKVACKTEPMLERSEFMGA